MATVHESDLEDLVLWPEQIGGGHTGLRVMANRETPNAEIVQFSPWPDRAQVDLAKGQRLLGYAVTILTESGITITTAVNLHETAAGAASYYESFLRDMKDSVGVRRPAGGTTVSVIEFDPGSIADACFGLLIIDVPPDRNGPPVLSYATMVEARRGNLIDVAIIEHQPGADLKDEAIRIAHVLDAHVPDYLTNGPK